MTNGPKLFGVPLAAMSAPTTSRSVDRMDAKEGRVCGRGVHFGRIIDVIRFGLGDAKYDGGTHEERARDAELEVRVRHRA